LLYLLWRQVKMTLGRTPSPEDLHDLADSSDPRFSQILSRANKTLLEETLRTAFDLPPLAAPLKPALPATAAVSLIRYCRIIVPLRRLRWP
jgi:hypothetical protein